MQYMMGIGQNTIFHHTLDFLKDVTINRKLIVFKFHHFNLRTARILS